MASGILIFPTVTEAIKAGYEIVSPHADSEGFLHARIKQGNLWAQALVRV